ncbi:alpha/beta-type small acid-soluble spore protein [Sporosalibacterium faouarense]|uniref:alpha/beta-type small acid-soluble spore protein n=1 Tax=Sporosalibacterium faouarense TaxID=516123 RepID=UPI0024361184|nr:alpha/beta-type small acid-soluble spore protein [Sporosalibacterium faouarense]
MARGPIDPKARLALDQMKYEIANELGVPSEISNTTSTNGIVDNIFFAGKVGGEMTKRLVEAGEKQLINKNNNF